MDQRTETPRARRASAGGRRHRVAATLAALVLAVGAGAIAGCGDDDNEGPAEEAGKALDEVGGEAGQAVEEADKEVGSDDK